jgi:hypothetical protein
MALFGLIPDFNDFVAFGKVIVIASILVIVGILFLLGKVGLVPKTWALVIGIGFIAGAVWYINKGGF